MEAWLFDNYELIWYCGFPSALLMALLIEQLWPARPWEFDRITRSFTNIGLFPINMVVQRAVFPVIPITLAADLQTSKQGLFNQIELPYLVEIISGFLLLDMMLYLHHIAMHKIPFLWRIHKPHHTDLDFDCTTGLRFHPLEAIFTLATSLLTVFLLGLAPISILLFNLVHIFSVYFTHLNLHFSKNVDRLLRLLLVTPDMHRVHHSSVKHETDSNYSTLISWWDYLFRTYCAHTEKDYRDMEIGLANYREPNNLLPLKVLRLPFEKNS